jgi:glycosyltransferase involved in cell wall biosynthesis
VNTKSVSIYIPAYNAEKTIKHSLESIKNQTHPFDEIIVINDNSSDFTENIVKEFNDVNIINNSKNKGLGYNRNLGMKSSSHQIVASIDADVVLEKNWLEIMIKNFSQHQTVICGGKMIEELTKNRFNAWRAKYYSQNWGDKSFENPPFLFGCNTIQNKSVWDAVGGYDEKLLTNGEDIDYTNKIKHHKHIKIKYCSDALSKHFQNDNFNSLSNRVWRYHSFGYKIKNPSIYKTFRLSLKQIKFFFKRSVKNLIRLEFNFIFINFAILIKFIVLEHSYYKKFKK